MEVLHEGRRGRPRVELTEEEIAERKKKQRERTLAYYFRNRDRLRAYRKKYMKEHREQFREYQRKYQANYWKQFRPELTERKGRRTPVKVFNEGMTQDFPTMKQAAEFIGVSPYTLRRYIYTGELLHGYFVDFAVETENILA